MGVKKYAFLFILLLFAIFAYSESISPTWTNQSQNATFTKNSVKLSAQLQDDTALDSAFLSTNETGVWVNQTSATKRFYITTDNQSRSTWNETFTGNENKTIWIKVVGGENLTNATLNLMPYGIKNISDSKKTISESSIIYSPNSSYFTDLLNGNDSNWDTYTTATHPTCPPNCVSGVYVRIYENYTYNPEWLSSDVFNISVVTKDNTTWDILHALYGYSDSTWWGIHDNMGGLVTGYTYDISKSKYISVNKPIQLRTSIHLADNTYAPSNIAHFFESQIFWYNLTYPTNPYIDTANSGGAYEWNYTGEFNSSVGSQQVDLNTTLINNYCSNSSNIAANGFCTFPITLHSDTAVIQISNITLSTNATNWANFSWSNSSITNQRVGWKMWFNDTSGNINSTDIMSFIVDSVNPLFTLFSPTNSTYNSANTSTRMLNYTASDTNLNTTWYQYNGTNTTITGNTTFTSLEGTSTLILYANDSAGNMNSTSVTFTVDTIAPTYSNLSINSTNIRKNDTILINVTWNDSFSGLAYYIFSTNMTGVWVNDTAVAFSGC